MDDMIVYVSDPKNSTRKLLQLINSFGKVIGYKIYSKKSVDLLRTCEKQAQKKCRETISFTIAPNNIIYFGINFNQTSERTV